MPARAETNLANWKTNQNVAAHWRLQRLPSLAGTGPDDRYRRDRPDGGGDAGHDGISKSRCCRSRHGLLTTSSNWRQPTRISAVSFSISGPSLHPLLGSAVVDSHCIIKCIIFRFPAIRCWTGQLKPTIHHNYACIFAHLHYSGFCGGPVHIIGSMLCFVPSS